MLIDSWLIIRYMLVLLGVTFNGDLNYVATINSSATFEHS